MALVSLAIGLIGIINRASGYGVLSLYVLSWAVPFVRAVWLEPHSGHGLVMLALFVYPLSVAAVLGGWVGAELLAASAVLPLSVLGVTLLTTGLLRAQRHAARALVEREHAQAQLRAAHESLEHRVAQRTAELRENIDGLESFNRSVSHDLRTPLGGIVGVARLGRQALAASDAAEAQRMLDLIESQAVNSVKLVEALLALARASDATMNLREVDTGPLVARRGGSLPTPAAPQIAVAPAMPTVDADPELLRQVFANLIGNAIKFARRRASPHVDVGHLLAGEPVFFVRDNGVGFEPDAAQRLFKPFQRLHDRRSTASASACPSSSASLTATAAACGPKPGRARARAFTSPSLAGGPGRRSASRREFAALKVLHRLHHLLARVHHERPVLHDRLAQRAAGHQQRARRLIARMQHHASLPGVLARIAMRCASTWRPAMVRPPRYT